jgi:hypothetical protein
VTIRTRQTDVTICDHNLQATLGCAPLPRSRSPRSRESDILTMGAPSAVVPSVMSIRRATIASGPVSPIHRALRHRLRADDGIGEWLYPGKVPGQISLKSIPLGESARSQMRDLGLVPIGPDKDF